MAKKNPDIQEEKPVEKQTPKVPSFKKSYKQIVLDNADRITKESKKEESETEEPEEIERPKLEKRVKEFRDEKRLADVEERVKETIKSTLEEKEKEKEEKVEKISDDDQFKKDLEERRNYIPAWVKEKRQPKDYDEIWRESKIASKLEREADELERNRDFLKKQVESIKSEEEKTRLQQDYSKNLETQVSTEFDELRELGKLPVVKDKDNSEDLGQKALKEFVDWGAEFNNKRVKEGKQPLFPLALMNYYKPKDNQPAGADAPIVGASNAPTPSESESLGIPYQQLHNLSYRQIFSNAIKKLGLK